MLRKLKFLFQKDPHLWFGPFFHRSYIFCLLMKNIIKNKNFFFATEYLFIVVISFLLLIKKVFLKIKKLILPPNYTRYEKIVTRQNFAFQKDLKLWSRPFIHRSYIFCLLMKNII